MIKYNFVSLVLFIILIIPLPIYAQYENTVESCIYSAIKDFTKGKQFEDQVYFINIS